MTIKEIYEAFEKIGCLTFATIHDDYPDTRIAHFRGYDDEGIYFQTMNIKPFYRQLKRTSKVSVCGLAAPTNAQDNGDGTFTFEPGYSIRIIADVKELPIEEIIAKNNPIFHHCIEDNKKYPAMVTFCLYRAKGEIFDYDFEKLSRDHKLLRKRFSYGGFPTPAIGLEISDNCINCGKCFKACSFNAIEKDGKKYRIRNERCDVCGDCTLACPANAIIDKETQNHPKLL